jgi:uncharacterized protein
MSHKPCWLVLPVLLLTLPFTIAEPSAALEVPLLHGRVNDLAGILSPTDTSELDQKLATIETETTNQIAILIIPSLKGDSLEEFSIRVARAWALGQKSRNNGVLIFMSVQDRAVRVEVGYGLEGALTDAQSAYIIRNIMVPAFRQQQYAEGLSRAVDAIAAAIAGEFKTEPKVPAVEPKMDFGTVIFWSILLLIFFSLVRFFQPFISGLIGAVLGLINGLWLLGSAPIGVFLLFGLIGSVISISIYYMNLFSPGSRSRRGPTSWSGGSRGMDIGGWGGSGGGGFSGGGGSFGGGGASGRW